MGALGHKCSGFVAMQRKDHVKAEEEFESSLKLKGDDIFGRRLSITASPVGFNLRPRLILEDPSGSVVGDSGTLPSGDPRLRDNTLIVVASDNGPEPGAGSAGPFSIRATGQKWPPAPIPRRIPRLRVGRPARALGPRAADATA